MKGDTFAFREIKNLLGDEMEIPNPDINDKNKLIDFDTFCRNAGYHSPYPKQIEFVNFAFGGGIRMVEAARKYGKTDYIAICGAAYEIYKDPKWTCVIINKDRDKAASIVSEIGNCLKANGLKLEVDSTRRVRVKGLIGKQDSAKAMSVRMSPKQNHPDFIICDDIIDIKDKHSQAERDYISDYYDALSGLCQNIVFLGQPVHAKDLYAKIKPRIKVKSYPHGCIPELDDNLDDKRAAGVTEEFIQANYFLKTNADETLPFHSVEEIDFFNFESSFAWIDGADGGGDDTSIAAYIINLGRVVVAGFNFSKPYYDCDKELEAIWKMFNARRGGFETNKFGKHPVILLRQAGFDFTGVETTVNKKAKIQNAATFKNNIKLIKLKQGEAPVNLIEANKKFNKQVKEYEYISKHDDAPDNIASAMKYLDIIKME